MLAGIFEGEPAPGDEVLHRLGDEHLRRSGRRADAGSDHHGDAADLPVDRLDLARVHARPNLDAERGDRVDDRPRAPDRPSRAVERGEEPVTRRVDLHAPIAGELATHAAVVFFDQGLPAPIAELGDLLRGSGDVGEQDGRQRPAELRLFLPQRDDEALHLVEDRVRGPDPGEVLAPREHHELGARDAARGVPGPVRCGSRDRLPCAITSVGTWIDGSAWEALIWRFMSSRATAALGLADFRMYDASHATSWSSDSCPGAPQPAI